MRRRSRYLIVRESVPVPHNSVQEELVANRDMAAEVIARPRREVLPHYATIIIFGGSGRCVRCVTRTRKPVDIFEIVMNLVHLDKVAASSSYFKCR